MRRADAFDVRRTLKRELEEGTTANIRTLLNEQGMSVTELGNRIGMVQQTIHRRFAGATRWSDEDLEAVAKVLHVTVERLVTPPK